MAKKITSQFFNTQKIDIMGNENPEQNISTSDFMNKVPASLVEYITEEYGVELVESQRLAIRKMVHDGLNTMKQLVKQEVIEEMHKQINNFDTFYK